MATLREHGAGPHGMTRVWHSSGWFAACIAVGTAIAPAPGFGADLPAPTPAAAQTVPDWIVTIGGELRLGPKWAGAPTDKFRLTGGPVFSIRNVGTPPE